MVLLAGCASNDEPPFEINNKQFHEKQDEQGNKLFAYVVSVKAKHRENFNLDRGPNNRPSRGEVKQYIEQEHFGSGDGAQGDVAMHYFRAVYTFARGYLTSFFVSLNRKVAADEAHEDWGLTLDYWQRQSSLSVEYIQNRLDPKPYDAANDTYTANGYVVAVV